MSAYPITRKDIARLRELLSEAHTICLAQRASGPVDLRSGFAFMGMGLADLEEMALDALHFLNDMHGGEDAPR